MQDLKQKVLENLKTKGYPEYQLKELNPIIQATIDATRQALNIANVVGRSELLGCKFCGAEDGKHGWTDDGEVCPLDRTA